MTFRPPPATLGAGSTRAVGACTEATLRVNHESERASVELIEAKNRRVHSTVLTTGTAPFALTDDDQIVLDRQPYAVAEDQLGMALTFVPFVTT